MRKIIQRHAARNRNPADLRIEPASDCAGWYVLRGSHGWLHGSKPSALDDLVELLRIERSVP
jgi:hypothetical protein